MHEHLLHNEQCALFVGCGLGKTAAVLDAVNDLFLDGAIRGVLVVAPLRVTNITWPAEIMSWDKFKWMKFVRLRDEASWEQLRRGEAQIYLINYEQLPKLVEKYLKGRRGPLGFDVVLWDELTRAKNHKSKRVNVLIPYLRKSVRRHWGMTGTPTPNSLLELFAQIRLLDGGERLGKSFGMYRGTYFFPTDYMEYNWVPHEGAEQKIYDRLKGFALVLKSSEWLDIPDVVQQDVEIDLCTEAMREYRELERDLLLILEDEHVEAVNAAVLVNKLLQLTSGAVYTTDGAWKALHDDKDVVMDRVLKTLRGEPVLVACQFKHEQHRLRQRYPKAVFFQDAKTHQAQIQVVDQWNAGKIPMLVSNPASMGHGLNLQGGGCNIIWRTPTWSRELYDQTNARLARRGQNKVVTVHRILARNTVDYAVTEALRRKDEGQQKLLDALKIWKRLR
jgi:SNF2 family DNA or RNA helicase